MRISENVKIAELTTMRLGGEARFVVEINEIADIQKVFDFVRKKKLPFFVMGGGANTIGRDDGFNGIIILNRLHGIEVISQTADEAVVQAMAGESWDDFVEFACARGYSGVEALSKIPGTVGAAPVQNIGAYGQEVSQTLESVEAYDIENDELVVLGKEDLKMSYRSTIFNTGTAVGKYFIVAVTFILENETSLKPPFYNSLQKYIDENNVTDFSPASIRKCVTAIRAEKLPDPKDIPSAGSFFKNIFLSDAEAEAAEARGLKIWTKNGGRKMLSAGYLIEGAGLKGREFYGFKISDKAALILMNVGKSNYANLAKARAEIRKIVFEKFGFRLEQEPVEITEDGLRSKANIWRKSTTGGANDIGEAKEK